jgi:glyoxylase-like metal-dependent hydrolase (beta-lactamase superfamily II)/8-oxo-dGTP pyrophosphatase MutT (NUDIX family)
MPRFDSPVTPRPAATVVLLREGGAGPEVFLQHRVRAMAFAPNVHVFPGGGVDERDRVSGIGWSGPPPAWWARRLGCAGETGEELAAALVCAAVRETFEECGVLLAGPANGASAGTPPAPGPDELAAARVELVEQRSALADVLARNGWVLRTDLLRPWANWVTPEVEPRRYDTYFFLAELPNSQHADAGTSEARAAGWRRPADALADWRADRIELMPPTWVTLEQIAELPDVATALLASDERVISPLVPKVRRDGDRLVLILPGELGYEQAAVQLRPPRIRPVGDGKPSGLLRARAPHPEYESVRAVTPTASVLLAKNPSPMTLDGTNTWLLRGGPDGGAEDMLVIDPGPDDERHLRLIAEQGPVAQILITHRHPDHAEGARRLAELTGAPVRALDPALVLGDEGLAEGDVVAAAGVELRVMATPGHSSDSLCFVLDDAVLTGDTVLGRGTTVIAYPDGRLGDYLASLRRLAELPDGLAVLPGHGPELPNAGAVARDYLAHREQRLEQVREALRQLGADATARQVVELVYADVDQVLWPAAEVSVRAQLDYLRSR